MTEETKETVIEEVKPEPVVVPKPVVETKPKKEKAPVPPPTIVRYKLNFRRLDGSVRYDLKKEVVMQVANDYGDLLRTISHNRFMTMDEIVDATWEFERKSVKKLWVRSRKAIEDGVRALIEHGIVIEK